MCVCVWSPVHPTVNHGDWYKINGNSIWSLGTLTPFIEVPTEPSPLSVFSETFRCHNVHSTQSNVSTVLTREFLEMRNRELVNWRLSLLPFDPTKIFHLPLKMKIWIPRVLQTTRENQEFKESFFLSVLNKFEEKIFLSPPITPVSSRLSSHSGPHSSSENESTAN